MNKRIIIDANFQADTRVALLNNNHIEDIEYENINKIQNKGNIYLAKITKIEPSLQAAFIDYGGGKSGFLPFSEVNSDYYHIPISDKKALHDKLSKLNTKNIATNIQEEKITTYEDISEKEIDIKEIEKLVDEQDSTIFDIEADENDIESIDTKTSTPNLDRDKSYKIQEVLKRGQIILVQLIKEERGNKCATFSTYISLAGKYCVLMPNKPNQNGVSKKISVVDERKRLKNIIENLISKEEATCSIILRTAAIGRTSIEIQRDYNYLVRLWNKIREVTLKSIAPCFIHQEEGIIQKTIRDMFNHTVKEVLIFGDAAYQNAIKFTNDILPNEINKIKEYKSKVPIFTKFGVEEQIANLYQPIVSLQSGGYIVIHPTEALISIDVNSGKSNTEKSIEETALKTNLEAAKEIARQLRLRDLSGLIVIDFIDMYNSRNRKIIERSLREFLSRDRARIQTGNISSFGLLEMSRQRLRSSFLESNTEICFNCSGKGLVRANDSNSMLILRTIENEIFNDPNISSVNVYSNNNAIVYLLNNQRLEIAHIERKYNIKLNFYIDPTSTSDSYSIEIVKGIANNNAQNIKPAIDDLSEIYQDISVSTIRSNKQKWYKKNDDNNIEDNYGLESDKDLIKEPIKQDSNNQSNNKFNKRKRNSNKTNKFTAKDNEVAQDLNITEHSKYNNDNEYTSSLSIVDNQENNESYTFNNESLQENIINNNTQDAEHEIITHDESALGEKNVKRTNSSKRRYKKYNSKSKNLKNTDESKVN